MFERFSTASRRAVFCGRWEAGFVGSEIMDSEHLLLGLVHVDPALLQFIAQPLTLNSIREAAVRWLVPRENLADLCGPSNRCRSYADFRERWVICSGPRIPFCEN